MESKEKVKKISVEEEVKSDSSFDAFFNHKEADTDIESFVSSMKQPREEIEPNTAFETTDEDDVEIGDDQPTDTDEGGFIEYDKEHYKTAEFILIQIDKGFGLIGAAISGEPMDKYRKRINRPQGDDYEAEITAALIKKYQMKLSLELMFLTAMFMAYSPVVAQAISDRKKKKKKEAAKAKPINT